MHYICQAMSIYISTKNKRIIVFGTVLKPFVNAYRLTKECAKYIKMELDTNEEFVRYFKYSYAPDELVIPTLVMNSQFRKKAFLTKSSSFEELATLHFVEYNKSIGIYDKRDYNRLMQSGKLFFRKAVSGKSEELISMVKESWITESLK